MENEFLDKVGDNAVVRTWSEQMQLEKRNSLVDRYVSELWDFTRISITKNEFQELKEIWTQWDDKSQRMFCCNYGDLPYLLDINVDKHLFRAITQFWNSAYSCFTFGEVDLVPTLEEYTTLLHCSRVQVDKAYFRAANVPTFVKKLVGITGMSEQWVTTRIQEKGEGKCIHWVSLRDLILAHPDEKKKIDVFALCIYVTDLFDRLNKGVTPVPAILAETFRSLNACRRAGEGRFIGCAQLLLVWFYSHFWKVDRVPYRVFSKSYSPLKEATTTIRRDDISEERWMKILQNLREDDVEWKAPWMVPDEVPLPGIWRAVGYAPLLMLRQYRARQFIPATYGLAQSLEAGSPYEDIDWRADDNSKI
ncbi:Nucleoside-triphosphatase THEP1 [Gossypium australe]|uniref:Nucleoside-triphosphatase THEP1 n=1 Tax=Gossypium australe TaxID=47621 RepID=A0A5B6VQ65_9ROSI|nr:Nucleoside-triphosphatase THEP1 [Gossypium australe]